MRAIFITARTSSSRLPGKCLMEVAHRTTAIEFLIKRLSYKGYYLVLCTSDSEKDDKLADVGRKAGVSVFRGSEDDKLKRWLDCAKYYNAEFFVTADGDDLFVEPELIEMAFNQYRNHWHGFINCPNTPSGSFSWGIETRALQRVYDKHVLTSGMNTEMGWSWFDDVHEIDNIPEEFLRKDVRMTLDYDEDLDFFKRVIADIGNASLRDILALVDRYPDIKEINIGRETDWKTNQNNLVKDIQ